MGEIKEIGENSIRLENNLVNKDKHWIPEYVVDAYDGKVLWLLVSSEDVARGYSYGRHAEKERYL